MVCTLVGGGGKFLSLEEPGINHGIDDRREYNVP